MPTPKDKFKFKNLAQSRAITLSPTEGEKRFDSEYYVEGYAARYEAYLLYDDGERKVYERFEPGCFDETDMSDVIMQFDHAGRVYARTTNKSLVVEVDNIGLFMAGDLSLTDGARKLYEDIDKKLVTKMSWRFRVGDYRVERTAVSKDITIVHTKIPKIYDVSAVSIPANDNTEINARNFFDGVIEEVERRDSELENKKRKLKTKILINGGLNNEN